MIASTVDIRFARPVVDKRGACYGCVTAFLALCTNHRCTFLCIGTIHAILHETSFKILQDKVGLGSGEIEIQRGIVMESRVGTRSESTMELKSKSRPGLRSRFMNSGLQGLKSPPRRSNAGRGLPLIAVVSTISTSAANGLNKRRDTDRGVCLSSQPTAAPLPLHVSKTSRSQPYTLIAADLQEPVELSRGRDKARSREPGAAGRRTSGPAAGRFFCPQHTPVRLRCASDGEIRKFRWPPTRRRPREPGVRESAFREDCFHPC
ncbi:hypothetical protein EVAR_82849_1 [Eumeta japonica]|uniref:Uncharacterized protein n=1 Tax=Eumeta variegata TaxID=151549 RepID=A0A4C1V2K9_EUMVA|nr:hypothetical protein EVAR_82849_1 [Eumeta japonica]